jgi:hypothetical protein
MRRFQFSLLDAEMRELVRRAAVVETAPPAARTRVLTRVEAIVGSSGGDGGAPGSATPPSVEPRPRVAGRALAVAAGFALGGAVGALVMYRVMHAPAPVESASVGSMEHGAATAAVKGPPIEPAAAMTLTAPSAQPLEPATSATRQRFASSPPASSRTTSRLASAPDQIAEERELLDAARRALEQEDGATALAATAEHARKYPLGALVQEREAIAVRALVLLGRMEEARTQVDRFREHFPGSLLLPALESGVGSAPVP